MIEMRRNRAARSAIYRQFIRAVRAAALSLAIIALPGGVGQAGEVVKGELYIVDAQDSERIERVEFQFDGQKFNVASPRRTHDLTASGQDVNALLDSLRGRKNAASRWQIQRVATDAAGTFSLPKTDSAAVLRIELEKSEEAPQQPGPSELPPIGGTLSGDDSSLTHVTLEADGSAYYLGTDVADGGTFGEIDLATNVTTRLLAGLPAAADVVDDPRTGELIVIGAEEIVQIQPAPEAKIVSRHRAAPGEALESGAVDGDGHLFVRRRDGEIMFVDYSANGRIGAAQNFTATARPGANTGQNIASTERADAARPVVTWIDVVIVLVAILALSSAFLVLRFRRAERTLRLAVLILGPAAAGWSGYLIYARFAGTADVTLVQAIVALLAGAAICAGLPLFGRARGRRPGGVGEELVYSRWPEDWSQLKRLVDSMSGAERAELGGQIESNPVWLDDAQALIRRPVRGGLSELRGSAAFGAALAQFAGGQTHSEWRGEDSDGLNLRVRHRLKTGAKADWSCVIVEASADEAFGTQASAILSQADGAQSAASPVERERKKKRRKSKKRRQSLGDIAADVGFFDIRWMFEGVARRIVEDGAASRLDLDAVEGLRMAGDADSAGAVLEDVLRATLAPEHGQGAAAPSLAVMAYEENGEIRFIALRSGAETAEDRPAPLSGAALQEARVAAAKNGGRVWVESAAQQVCSFTLAGGAPNTGQGRAKKLSGWRPAQPEAVWSMRSQGDASRF